MAEQTEGTGVLENVSDMLGQPPLKPILHFYRDHLLYELVKLFIV